MNIKLQLQKKTTLIILLVIGVLGAFSNYTYTNKKNTTQKPLETNGSSHYQNTLQLHTDPIIMKLNNVSFNTSFIQMDTYKKIDNDALAHDPNNPQMFNGYPPHLLYLWSNTDSFRFNPTHKQLRIFSIFEYRDYLPAEISNYLYASTFQTLDFMLRSDDFTYRKIPTLPFAGYEAIYQSQQKIIPTVSSKGVRFVTQFKNLDSNQVTSLVYTYQGLSETAFEKFYISFYYPIKVINSDLKLENNYNEQQINEIVSQLNTLNSDSFDPPLGKLDSFIHSIKMTLDSPTPTPNI